MAIQGAAKVADKFELNLEQPEDDYLTESDNESSGISSTASQADLNLNQAILNNYVIAHANDGTDTRHAARQTNNDESNKIINQAREYQQELFDRAKEENVIAVLDTGSGKTLIAALLIRHHLQQEIFDRSQGKPAKIVFFLVNSVHLARQQARFLSNNLPERVVPLFGATSDDLWKKAEWDRIFAENSIVVCTAAVLDSCLMHSYLTIGQISLLVFDEAHHAKKNHPYSRIIRDYYLKWNGDRPRIFGMTASPVDSRRDIGAVVKDLEALLQSKIVTTNDLSIFEFAPRAEDASWYYSPLDGEYETELYTALRPLCGFVYLLEPYFRFARMASKHLGSWAADRIWKYGLPTSTHESDNIIRKYERSDEYIRITDLERRAASLDSVRDAIAMVSRHNFAKPRAAEDREMSPKVRKLYEELRARFSAGPTTRSIVFIEERLTATILCDLFVEAALPNLRPGVLVGNAQSGKEGGSWKDQETIMEKFRIGAINIIFATSVAEEGIDIPQCNLVIRFDLYKTPIQYMQSRGRARMKNSVFAHMIEEGNKAQEGDVNYAIAQADYIKDFCQGLSPDRLLGQGSKLRQLLSRDASCQTFVTGTGVLASYANSLLLLNRYTESLKKVGATSFEVYEEMIGTEENMFQYKVILPTTNDERTAAVKGAKGEARTNKQLAKRSAAWHCVFKLRKQHLLDDNLDSIFIKLKPPNLNACTAVSEKKDDYDKKVKPDFWVDSGANTSTLPTELFVTHVRIEPRSDSWLSDGVLLFTRARLPDIPVFSVYVDNNVEKLVSFQPFKQPVNVTPDQVEALTKYTLHGIFHDIFNKQYDQNSTSMSYWLAPPSLIFPSQLFEVVVNMDELVAAGVIEREKWNPSVSGINNAEKWCGAFLVDPGSGKFRYFSSGIVPGKTIFDAAPDSAKIVKKKYDQTIIEYTDSTWRAKTKDFEKEVKERYDSDQPVLNAKVVVAGRKYVEKCPEKEQRFASCHIAPQPLEVARISYKVAQTCIMWPSILHRLEGYLIVQEAFRKLDLEQVPLDLALEAFTQDSYAEVNTSLSNTSSTQNRQEVGDDRKESAEKAAMNYERLEFIGDSLLKMMTTITVYNRTTCNEEGMHCKRMELLSNRRLCSTACEPHYELFRYIRSAGDNWRDTWYPEFLERKAGKNRGRIVKLTDKHRKHALGKKTIADVCEATIGACVMTGQHLPTAEKFDLGIEAITKLVEHPDHAIKTWKEVLPMYKPAAWVGELNDPIANDYANKVFEVTGYRFKHPRLIRSAFTHSSDQNSPVQDLQRLEFLGDAALDWVCIWWLFSTNPTKDPQWLTEHKMAMVSNKFLAALAVTLGFNKFVYATSPAVYEEIGSYASKVQEAWTDPDVKPDFWTKVITGSNVPKVLADLVESYLGAVLVDSGFDFREIEKFFEKHVLWHFKDIELYDTFANRHPTTYLVKLLTQEFRCRKAILTPIEGIVHPTTDASKDHEDEDDDAGAAQGDDAVGGVMCHVAWMVHGKIVGKPSQGTGVRYAKVRASKTALKILGKLKVDEFRKEWGCDCQTEKERKASLADVSGNGSVNGSLAGGRSNVNRNGAD